MNARRSGSRLGVLVQNGTYRAWPLCSRRARNGGCVGGPEHRKGQADPGLLRAQLRTGHCLAGLLITLALGGQAQAAQGWEDLGEVLNTACQVVSGSGTKVGKISIPGVDFGANTEKLQWLCQLRAIHGYIDSNILNGDWEQFAGEVAGEYVGKFIGYAGTSLGSEALSTYTTNLNKALGGGYKDFRKALFGSVAAAYDSRQSLNAGADPQSVGGKTEAAFQANPGLAAAQQLARARDTLEAAQGLQVGYHAKKIQTEAAKALEVNTAQAVNNATEMIGTPLKGGIIDKYVKAASTAISTREVTEVQVQLLGAATRQQAAMDVALMNQLGEMVQQQVMTNVQLMKQSSAREQEIMNNEAELTAAVENEILENRLLADQYAGEIKGAYRNLKGALDSQGVALTSLGE